MKKRKEMDLEKLQSMVMNGRIKKFVSIEEGASFILSERTPSVKWQRTLRQCIGSSEECWSILKRWMSTWSCSRMTIKEDVRI